MSDDKINSADDRRIENNPPQRPNVPSDPMRLQYRLLSDREKALMGEVKRDFEDLWVKLGMIGWSRELSLAKTHLEDACMWAVKHITAPAAVAPPPSVGDASVTTNKPKSE